jgi:hypothetical protein
MPNTGNPITVERESLLIVYDQDGRISDVHHFVTAKGGKHPTESEQEEATLELAAKRGTDIKKVSLLRVDPLDFDLAKNYRVDPVKRILVDTPRLTRQGKPAPPEFSAPRAHLTD